MGGECAARAGDLIELAYRGPLGVMRFAIHPAGDYVWAGWNDECPVKSVNDATGVLLGPVLGGLLRLRGTVSLHACALEVASRAVVLLGERQAGKSTIAVAAARRGHAVLSDDVAAIAERPSGRWIVEPGYPRLRLPSAGIRALAGPARDAGPVGTFEEKRYLELHTGGARAACRFRSEPLPLGTVYELRRDPEIAAAAVEPVTGADRVATLLRHTRRALAPLDEPIKTAEFARVGRLAASVPIRRLVYPSDLKAVPAIWRTIVNDHVAG